MDSPIKKGKKNNIENICVFPNFDVSLILAKIHNNNNII